MKNIDNGNVNLYKTYKCQTCEYSADVYGETIKTIQGVFETHVCLNCMCLIEVIIADRYFNELKELHFKETEPQCLLCGKLDTIKWNNHICKCPKCNGKMYLKRLELNIFNVGTIKLE